MFIDWQCPTPGLVSPVLYLPVRLELGGSSAGRVLSLYSYFGLGWVLGCGLGGAVITSTTSHCFISRQWLCQVS